ncbi:hypothetical protein GP486_000415 [Trichoglossum hirsutum]|uniref:Cytochrome P450 n=1 Tax=Trichoglossum hirsutum TaxID=265104 RepID=A0A9P8LIY8_9PEZI|nr:hypothetical protein GP486_000415 [Trichoglossum hirsutum]
MIFLTSLQYILQYLPTLVVICLTGAIVYRLYLHPLAHIPGPRLAAATDLYGFYFNVISGGGGRFFLQIEKLHQKYGPVVRIAPNEIHLSDPENYDRIYHIGAKYYKCPKFYGCFGLDSCTFCTWDSELHRVRRAALNPRFSRKSVLELEGVVQSKVQKLCQKVADMLHTNKPVDLHHGFRAISIDVITDYAFDNCYDLLDKAGFGLEFFSMIDAILPTFWIFYQWPLLQSVAMNIPAWLAKLTNKHIASHLKLQQDCREQVMNVRATIDEGKPPTRITIFHQLLRADAAEGHVVPSAEELVEEASGVVAASSETTGNALTFATYNVLANKRIHAKLTEELKESFPNPSSTLDFVTLEKLPYLNAVIKESLRLSFGIIGRLPRVTPSGDVLNGYIIPPGTTVGMSSWLMHRNEDAFPEPDKFDPGRWLDPESAKLLEKYLVPFSRGSRQCIGIPLAYCEIYVALGTFFRQFENLEIYNTSPEDLAYVDYFAATHPFDARKFHVVLKKS